MGVKFQQDTAFESANDPLERFLYPSLSAVSVNKIKKQP